MTNKERRIIFIHSKLCSIYNELNHTIGLFDLFDDKTKDIDKKMCKILPLIDEAYLTIEKAHEQLARIVDENTVWEDAVKSDDTNSTT